MIQNFGTFKVETLSAILALLRIRDVEIGKLINGKTLHRGIGLQYWGAQAESCNTYLAKGRRVLVSGTVSARGYVNNNGEAAASLELRAREVRFLSGRDEAGDQGSGWSGGQRGGGQRSGGQQSQPRDDRASNYPASPASVDDIPF